MSEIKFIVLQPSSTTDGWVIYGEAYDFTSIRIDLDAVSEQDALVRAAQVAQEHGLDRVYFGPAGFALKRFWVDAILEAIR